MASSPRFVLNTFVAALGCGLFRTLAGPVAFAHGSRKSSSLAANAHVSGLEEIRLEYSARVGFPVAVPHDGSGRAIGVGKPRLDGPKVMADVSEPLTAGGYTIAWT
ncbi:hypothetical protein ACOZ38_24305 [Sphaerisporangium viridialbum]|uniref:hypothetical protein n=1 Tax=Sphaerisporangium viridialbum TaxID=46189 RepID=UPI003C78AFB9